MKPVTILVVDDDYDIRRAVEQCLAGIDIEPTVLTARNALTGLQLAKEHIPDVVVLDLQMPMGSGFDCVSKYTWNSSQFHERFWLRRLSHLKASALFCR